MKKIQSVLCAIVSHLIFLVQLVGLLSGIFGLVGAVAVFRLWQANQPVNYETMVCVLCLAFSWTVAMLMLMADQDRANQKRALAAMQELAKLRGVR